MIKRLLPILLLVLLILSCATGPAVKDGYVDYQKVNGYLFNTEMAFEGDIDFFAITTKDQWERHFVTTEDSSRSTYFDFKDESPLILAIVFNTNSLITPKVLSLEVEDGALIFEYSAKAIQENLPSKKYYTLILTTDMRPFTSVKFVLKDKVQKEIPFE